MKKNNNDLETPRTIVGRPIDAALIVTFLSALAFYIGWYNVRYTFLRIGIDLLNTEIPTYYFFICSIPAILLAIFLFSLSYVIPKTEKKLVTSCIFSYIPVLFYFLYNAMNYDQELRPANSVFGEKGFLFFTILLSLILLTLGFKKIHFKDIVHNRSWFMTLMSSYVVLFLFTMSSGSFGDIESYNRILTSKSKDSVTVERRSGESLKDVVYFHQDSRYAYFVKKIENIEAKKTTYLVPLSEIISIKVETNDN